MTVWNKLTRAQIAELVARDIPDGAYVNLGIGMPTLIAQHLPADREVILHSENGIVGMTNVPTDGPHDPDIINAGKEFMGLVPGASITDHVTSFAMMRGAHIDLTVLGAFQVSRMGDLANWDTGDPSSIPAVGGAMDLAAGAKQVFVMMEHVDKKGAPKIVTECTYPLTGARVVDRIYTDLAIIDVPGDGRLIVRAMVEGLTLPELQKLTAAPLTGMDACQRIAA
ncbi:MAG: 3-oxoadipate CoA-transferase, beta subunit [Methylobacteriaceae bacterium]|nr:3-oxoadipate CoA-transferase, beta subunit [Methylobacteriaceae bacterium]